MAKLKSEALQKVFEPYLEAASGDWRLFADMIERGEPLPQPARKIIADHLRGKSPPPSRRKRQQQRLEYRICDAVFNIMKTGASKYAAINAVADASPGLKVETIKTYLKNYKSDYETVGLGSLPKTP
jgi:hypothetical protein